MKSFIITIDTEGDDLWSWKAGQTITTENARFLPRFQNLCDRYGFKPVWLTNYEMVVNPDFVSFTKEKLRDGCCEIGMHLHALNNPPLYDLEVRYPANFPYLIEYPEEIIAQKVRFLHELLNDTYGENIISHRAGRWAMNEFYLQCLIQSGVRVDCSVTPGIDWSSLMGATRNSHGSDYSKSPVLPYYLDEAKKILELPVSIRTLHSSDYNYGSVHSILRGIKHRVWGHKVWLRPKGHNLNEMMRLASVLKDGKSDYLMFMLHSSELMPGGSPTFKTKEDIEKLYQDLEKLFAYISTFCEGKTLKEYASAFDY
jgi:hypothetical protein